MSKRLTISLVQMSPHLGDVLANLSLAGEAMAGAAAAGGQLVCLPELFLTGYHPDLLGEQLQEVSQGLEGRAMERLGRIAASWQVYLVMVSPSGAKSQESS